MVTYQWVIRSSLLWPTESNFHTTNNYKSKKTDLLPLIVKKRNVAFIFLISHSKFFTILSIFSQRNRCLILSPFLLFLILFLISDSQIYSTQSLGPGCDSLTSSYLSCMCKGLVIIFTSWWTIKAIFAGDPWSYLLPSLIGQK